jgi:hypothetical protein
MTVIGSSVTLQVRDDGEVLEPYRRPEDLLECYLGVELHAAGCGGICPSKGIGRIDSSRPGRRERLLDAARGHKRQIRRA